MRPKKSLTKLLSFAAIGAALAYSGWSAASSPAVVSDTAIDSPAPIRPPKTDYSRVQRKPAIEPRVYLHSYKDAQSKTRWVYYDYTDQEKPAVAQRPPDYNPNYK